LLRKGVNLSFCRKHVLALNFAFISEVKHIPWGAQKMQFSGGWKKIRRRERESWKTLDRSRKTNEGFFKVGWEAISD